MNFSAADVNPVEEILNTPDCLDIEGAERVQLTDSSDLQAALRRNPANANAEVYEWHTTKLPAHEVLTMTEVKDIVVSLCQDVNACRTLPEVQTMKLDEFRAWLIDRNPRYREFFRKFPHLFRLVVGPNGTPANLGHIFQMIEMKRNHVESSKSVTQQQQEISAYCRQHFMREAKPGEEEEAVRTGRGYRGTPMTRDQVRQELSGSKS